MSSFLDYSTAGQTANNPLPVRSTRDPTTSDVIAPSGAPYNVGRVWVNQTTRAVFIHSGNGVWVSVAGGSETVTALTVTPGPTSITGTTNINTSGSGVTSIGTGGTGATNIGNATGNTAVTGSLTASTTLTATLGNITASNGNLVLTAAGNKMIRTSVASTTAAGANSIGTVTLVGGTATIATTAITASSIIKTWRESIGATGAAATGNIVVGTRTAGVSFVINAVSAANATALAATDVSVIGWEIIN